jgi:hypothetical protein
VTTHDGLLSICICPTPGSSAQPLFKAFAPCSSVSCSCSCSCSLTTSQIMELYMDLASVSSSSADDAPDSGGLGFLDSTKSAIEIDWELSPGVHEVDSGIVETRGEDAASTSGIASRAGGAGSGSRRRTTGARAVKRTRPNPAPARSVQVRATIQQDLGALKGRKGDTGERSAAQRSAAGRGCSHCDVVGCRVADKRRQRAVAKQVSVCRMPGGV